MEQAPQGCSTFAAGAILVFATLFLLSFSFVFLVFNQDRRQCVALPNGLYLGYAAVFDFAKDSFSVGGTIKFANGQPLVDQDLWSVFVSDTSAFGDTLALEREGGAVFAWRADTGVVLRHDDPQTYGRIIEEAGPLNHGVDDWVIEHEPRWPDSDIPGSGPTSYGPISLMNTLAKMPEFETRPCTTRMVNW